MRESCGLLSCCFWSARCWSSRLRGAHRLKIRTPPSWASPMVLSRRAGPRRRCRMTNICIQRSPLARRPARTGRGSPWPISCRWAGLWRCVWLVRCCRRTATISRTGVREMSGSGRGSPSKTERSRPGAGEPRRARSMAMWSDGRRRRAGSPGSGFGIAPTVSTSRARTGRSASSRCG